MIEDNESEKKKPWDIPFKKNNTFGCGPRQKKERPSLFRYIKNKTKDGKVLTDFHVEILRSVENSSENDPPMYKGMRITAELATKAVDWPLATPMDRHLKESLNRINLIVQRLS